MPTAYPAEFRRRAIALVEAGQSVAKTASDLGVTQATLYNWVKQDKIDRGLMSGRTTTESKELRRARMRIRVLEAEVEILRRANDLLGEGARRPKGSTRRSTFSSAPGSRSNSAVECSTSLPRTTKPIETARCLPRRYDASG